MEDSSDDKIFFSSSLFDRLISCTGIEYCEKEMKEFLKNYLLKSWECQTVCFYFLIVYSNFDQEFEKVQGVMKVLYTSVTNANPKLRFAAIHCLNKFCDNYNPSFQKETIKEMIPLLENILKTTVNGDFTIWMADFTCDDRFMSMYAEHIMHFDHHISKLEPRAEWRNRLKGDFSSVSFQGVIPNDKITSGIKEKA